MPIPDSPPPRMMVTLAGFNFRSAVEKTWFREAIANGAIVEATPNTDGTALRLARDYDNQYDAYAVRVYWDHEFPYIDDDGDEAIDTAPLWIGFIDRKSSELIGQWMDRGFKFTCSIDSFEPHDRHILSVTSK